MQIMMIVIFILLGYTLRDLGTFSKQLDLDYYYSKVDHPMSGKLRIGGLMPTL